MTERWMTEKMEECYKALGVDRRVLYGEVESAYRRLSEAWNPDLFDRPAEKERALEKLREVKAAYMWLKEFRYYGISRLSPKEPEKQFELANEFMVGVRMPGDFIEAVKQYQKAADQGHAEAQFMLYQILGDGLYYFSAFNQVCEPWQVPGVHRDMIESYKWLILAAAQGHKNAGWALMLRPRMPSADVAEAKRRAAEFLSEKPWCRKSAARLMFERARDWLLK
jgi:TPR repeat protein